MRIISDCGEKFLFTYTFVNKIVKTLAKSRKSNEGKSGKQHIYFFRVDDNGNNNNDDLI